MLMMVLNAFVFVKYVELRGHARVQALFRILVVLLTCDIMYLAALPYFFWSVEC